MKKIISDTMKLAIRASYDKYKLSGMSAQKAMEAVGSEMDLHWQTIRKIVKSTQQSIDHERLGDIKKSQASKIDKIVGDIIKDLDLSDKTLKGMSAAQAVMALCQLIDKSMKLKGEDVQKVEIHEVGEKIHKRLQELRALRENLQKSMVVSDKPEDN